MSRALYGISGKYGAGGKHPTAGTDAEAYHLPRGRTSGGVRDRREEEQLGKIIKYLNLTGSAAFSLGNGSNLLVGDKGYRGVVIRLGREFEPSENGGHPADGGASVLLSAGGQGGHGKRIVRDWNLPPEFREAWAAASR